MVGAAPVRRGINAARNELQSRPVGTKWLALGRRGSFMIWYARFHGVHATAQRLLLLRALGFLKMHHRASCAAPPQNRNVGTPG